MRSSWLNGIFERLLEVKNIPALFSFSNPDIRIKRRKLWITPPPPYLPSDLWCFLVFFCLKNCYNDGITCCFTRQLCERRLFVFLNDEFDVPYQKYLDPPIFRIFCLIYLITRCKAVDKKCGRSYGISVKALLFLSHSWLDKKVNLVPIGSKTTLGEPITGV